MKFESLNFLKNKSKGICFFALKSYSFDKFENNLSEAESFASEDLIEPKDLVIEKVHKGKIAVFTNRTKYLDGIKSLILDSKKISVTSH